MISQERLKQLLFPHKNVRNIQDNLIEEVDECIRLKKNMIIHAPTGLGKTASTLPVALSHAIKNNLTVFFLTSRHTQHLIAIETLKEIKKKYGLDFTAVDIIGKKWMCPVPGTDELYSSEFFDFCKSMRSDNKCEFYSNSRKTSGRPTIEAQKAVKELKSSSPAGCENLTDHCREKKLCPYEISALLAKEASVIVADYYYIFSESIRDTFFNKTEKELSRSIIIIDEGHNLPKRARDLLTDKLSSYTISSALKEASKYGYNEAAEYLQGLRDIFRDYSKGFENKQLSQKQRSFFSSENEKLVKKEEFAAKVRSIADYDAIITALEFAGDEIREAQKKSYIGSIAHFLDAWLGPDEAFARILSYSRGERNPSVTLSYRCLDPSLLTRYVSENAYCSIIMSGTLTPTFMYKDLLGFNSAKEKEYSSPFPSENKLSMIIPDITTRYAQRSPEQYQRIAAKLSKIVNNVPGNSAVFFPSYRLRDDVNRYFSELCKKTTFIEMPGMSKIDKQDLLDQFKSYKNSGAVLLGVAAANYAEGIDLPGDLLKAVVVVGLPLQRPDLETKELIDYYDKKYRAGWDYAYIFPAITKTLQSAGRCIRSETDRGVVAFMDERYAWPKYSKCFPPDWNIKITKLYENRIREFFVEDQHE